MIRHAQTLGNAERRYIGRTDEPLSPAGLASFCNTAFPLADRVYASPMLRCRQTAQLAYPAHQAIALDGLREYDFGEFEGKNYQELKDLETYQKWIDSGGQLAAPGGESMPEFKRRCCRAFSDALQSCFAEGIGRVSFILHGGVIMALMERFAVPPRGFYDWQPPHLGGWQVQTDLENWENRRTFALVGPVDGRG